VEPRKVDPELSQVCARQVATITRQKDPDARRIIPEKSKDRQDKETKRDKRRRTKDRSSHSPFHAL